MMEVLHTVPKGFALRYPGMLMVSLASALVVNELRAPTNPKASAAIGMNLLNLFIK
ncbi:hypothetical protein [Flavobacterium sp. TBRC 19031]|uniref:hypothetical protein n=1 Tax=Flavobacterium mekongense TaxID=3379707 RepID=UPI00399BCF76